MNGEVDVRHRPKPLNGWRAIADYLGRNQSTVKRWANDGGLPVHRPQGSAARKGVPVYAFAHELDTWLRGQRLDRLAQDSEDRADNDPQLKIPLDGTVAAIPTILPSDPTASTRKHLSRRTALIGGAGLSFLLLAGAGLWQTRLTGSVTSSDPELSDDARGLYHRGLFHMDLRTSEGLIRAIGLFKDALALEPNFTDASAALAQTYNLAVQYGALPQEEGYPLALATVRTVLARAPDHPGGLAALAFNTFYWLRHFTTAYELFERALERDPENADVRHWYALAVMHDRKFDVALREITAAQTLAPTSPSVLANRGLILHHAGRNDEAINILEPLAEAQPEILSPVSYLATIYLHIGYDREFVNVYRQAAELIGDPGRIEVAEAAHQGLARGGRVAMLEAMLGVQTQLLKEGHKRAFRLAVTAAYLDRADLALDYLELAVEKNEPDVLGVKLELPHDSLKDSRRYADLVRMIGFSQG